MPTLPIKIEDKNLDKAFRWLIDNLDDRYKIIETAVPNDDVGKNGEIKLINDDGTYYICAKIDGSWRKVALT